MARREVAICFPLYINDYESAGENNKSRKYEEKRHSPFISSHGPWTGNTIIVKDGQTAGATRRHLAGGT